MDKFLGKAAKQPLPNSGKRKSADYEQEKRKRGFVPSWEREFSWIRYDKEEDKIFCVVCCDFDKVGPFVTGTASKRKDCLKSHDTSSQHLGNLRKYTAKRAQPGSSVAEKTLQTLSQKAFNSISHLFRTVHGLSKKGRPYTDYVWICELDITKGVDIGEHYRNDKQAAKFSEFISLAEMNKIRTELENVRHLSIILDGSTDSSKQEAELFLIRFSNEGVVKVKFIAVKNVGKGDAETVSLALHNSMIDNLGDNYGEKVVGFGTDGAAVMLGIRNGLVAKMKSLLQRPFIVGIHCSGHR